MNSVIISRDLRILVSQNRFKFLHYDEIFNIDKSLRVVIPSLYNYHASELHTLVTNKKAIPGNLQTYSAKNPPTFAAKNPPTF